MKYTYPLTTATLLAVLLTGCSSTGDITNSTVKAAPVPHGQQQLSQQLHADGVVVIPQGQQIDFVIPVNQFFTEDDTQIKTSKQADFKYMAEMIQAKGQAAPVVVTGYTDKSGTPTEQTKRAHASAEVIAAYLWNQGINSKQISVHSQGSANPIAYDDTVAGKQANRRIVVAVNHPSKA